MNVSKILSSMIDPNSRSDRWGIPLILLFEDKADRIVILEKIKSSKDFIDEAKLRKAMRPAAIAEAKRRKFISEQKKSSKKQKKEILEIRDIYWANAEQKTQIEIYTDLKNRCSVFFSNGFTKKDEEIIEKQLKTLYYRIYKPRDEFKLMYTYLTREIGDILLKKPRIINIVNILG